MMLWAVCYNCVPDRVLQFSLPSFTQSAVFPLNATLMQSHPLQGITVLGNTFILVTETEQSDELYFIVFNVTSSHQLTTASEIRTGLVTLPLTFYSPNDIITGTFADGTPPAYIAELYQLQLSSNMSVQSRGSFQIANDAENQGYLTDSRTAVCSWLNGNTLALLAL